MYSELEEYWDSYSESSSESDLEHSDPIYDIISEDSDTTARNNSSSNYDEFYISSDGNFSAFSILICGDCFGISRKILTMTLFNFNIWIRRFLRKLQFCAAAPISFVII